MTSTFLQVVPWCKNLLFNPKYVSQLACLVVVGDFVLTQLIMRFVAYTEIDWETYMQHIELYTNGERNYTAITGSTGPLVYPVGHVYIYELLYKVTNSGLDIARAQQLFAALYTISQALVCAIYVQAGGVPNWTLCILPLSKRLHSIYVLRLFNDCWAVVGAQAAILAISTGYYSLGCILFSLAISVKMSVLLYMPALAIILLQQLGGVQTFTSVALMLLFQAIVGWPFLSTYPRDYLAGAFDFSRQFLFKWTVNWRFLGEELFLSSVLSIALLLVTAVTLLSFAHVKWVKGGLVNLVVRASRNIWRPVRRVSPDYITTLFFTSNLIGITLARSLHYQFYSWYAQQLPFLLWRTPFPILIKMPLLLAIEYAWNVYPSTSLSSFLLVSSNALMIVGIWFGWPTGRQATEGDSVDKKET